MNPVEAYLWLKNSPDIGSVEELGLRKYVVAGYAIFLPGPGGLLEVKTERPNLVEFEKLEGLLGESIVTVPVEGPSKNDVSCFARIIHLSGHTREVALKLSKQDYVRQASFAQGYGGDHLLVKLTDMGGVPYTDTDAQREVLEKVIEPIAPNFRIEPSLVNEKVI
jgi:hypothetical protein